MSAKASNAEIGAARVAVYDKMRILREYMEVADLEDEPRFHKAIKLNNLAHHVSVAVRDLGRLL